MSNILTRQVRAVLETEGSSVADLLVATDDFVLECSSSPEAEVLVFELEEQLHQIHNEVIDHSSLHHIQVFLAVLYHLRPILPSISIISSWFDLILRPALREPKLPVPAVNHAKELVVSALRKDNDGHVDKITEFRCRLLDLYLLDAFNEGSGEDILEWAELDDLQREIKTRWKSNLEDILLKYGQERPSDLMTEINAHFANPASRLQLLILINLYTSVPTFQSFAAVLATHPLMSSLLHSLLLDNSFTSCTIEMSIFVKLLPIFAVEASEALKSILPQLLSILAKMLCWRERPRRITPQSPEEEAVEEEPDQDTGPALCLRDDLSWQVLELSLDGMTSAPSPRHYYTLLYYLFPCNVLQFLKSPVLYLTQNKVPSPYNVDWDAVFDEQKVRSKSETLLKSHVCHPLILWRDASDEISSPDFWAGYDVARIVTESMMLDVRNTAQGLRERYATRDVTTNHHSFGEPSLSGSDDGRKTPKHTLDRSEGETRLISLEDMIATSVALKSNLNVKIAPAAAQWPTSLFAASPSSPPSADSESPTDAPPPPPLDDKTPPHIAQAISGLQREVLLLRSELNFELWLSRENVKHIGRLYQSRTLSRDAEVERQGLYNKLRKYRTQVAALEAELQNNKANASSTKERFADWNTELQNKLSDFREQKKKWTKEETILRTADKQAKALFEAQGKLLAEASKEVFGLQTQIKESQHKIDRLHDYEYQIEQHIKVQRLWDADFSKFNDRGEELRLMKTQYKQMEMRLQCLHESEARLEENARVYRRQIQALEAQLLQEKRKTEKASRRPEEIAAFVAEKKRLMDANAHLLEDNATLREEIEEITAMVEVLRGQVSGRKGLVSDPRASPILYG
ncbi:hypothetical protein GGX14DRAFT_590318 [Mycena pura]|uniref:Hamartin n=1 Tax=Mycena pura TaxID=153505 RepID=A0AAD6VPC8_9AGAR|nr:hypothetical protein GGX14DRAFT_590318 [Mycena pura]